MKIPETIVPLMLASCGIDCMVCYVHLREKKPCSGCRAQDDTQPGHRRKCRIRNCAEEKGVSHCFRCEEFPCRLLKNLERSYRRYGVSPIENLRRAQAAIEKFLQEERSAWTCPGCGSVVSLHEGQCSECRALAAPK